MKTIITLMASLILMSSIQAQSIKSFFNDLEDKDDYAIITINKEMFRMIASFDVDFDDKDIKELVKNIKRVRIFSNEDAASFDDFKEIRDLARETSMNNLISVKDGSERVELFTGGDADDRYVDGLLLLVREENQNVFIEMDGKINLDALASLTDKLDIDGFDQLKKIGG